MTFTISGLFELLIFLTDQSTTPASKKKRATWSEESLANAIHDIRNGLSVSNASTQYGIPKSTLRLHMDNGIIAKRLGRHTTFSEDQERDFVSLITKFSELGIIPLTSKMIRIQAFAYCNKFNIPNHFNKKAQMAGKAWLQLFLKNNQILKVSQAQKQHKTVEEIQELYNDLGNIHYELKYLFAETE